MAKPGPKTEPELGELRRVQALLDRESLRRLKVVGDGNLSRGIRLASRVAYEAYQRSGGPESKFRG